MRLTIASFYFTTWMALLALSLALGLNAHLIPAWGALPAAIFGIWTLLPHHDRKPGAHRPRLAHAAILGAFLALAGSARYYANRDLLALIGSGVTAIVPILLFRGHRSFGHWMALLTLSLLALIGVIGSGSISSYLLFIAYLLGLVFHLNSSNLLALGGQSALNQPIAPGYLRQFLPCLLVGIASAALIFVFFPRTRSVSNPLGIRQRNNETGYTGKVALTGGKPISESSALAMMVEAPDPKWLLTNGPDLYFHGNTLDTFDGVRWTASPVPSRSYENNSDLRYSYSYGLTLLPLKLYREPHATRAILYPGMLLNLTAPWRLLGGVRYDANADLTRENAEVLRYAYSVLIAPLLPPKKTMGAIKLAQVRRRLDETQDLAPLARIGPGQLDSLLQIPQSVRQAHYFRHWVEEVGVDARSDSLFSALEKLRRHFAAHFRATFANQFSGNVPFEAFLEKDRQGHCEYFATAAALFLRSFGVPTRLVLGYRGGTYNQVSKVLEVREANAHAWTEVYVPGSGWARFDPTPIGLPIEAKGIPEAVTLYLNAVKFWFNRYVINYDSQAQKDLMKSLIAIRLPSPKLSDLPGGMLSFWALILLSASCLFAYWLLLMQRGGRRPATRALPAYYLSFQRRLAARGEKRAVGETFVEFHARLADKGWDASLLREIDSALESDLYSPP